MLMHPTLDQLRALKLDGDAELDKLLFLSINSGSSGYSRFASAEGAR